MARVLHIQVSPMQQLSFSRRVAEAFLERYRRDHPGDEVRTMDLAKERLPAFDFPMASAKYKILHGRPQSKEEAQVWKAVEETIARFKEADKLVVSSPMWNFGIPYALKQYLDVIVQPTYTFSYSPEEGYKGLVTGRPALLVLARGGSYGAGSGAEGMDFQRPYLEAILRFMGFTAIETLLVEPTLAGGPKAAEETLKKAIAAAEKMAEKF